MIVDLNSNDRHTKSAIESLARAFRQKKVVPFLGAGISVPAPSCVPSGWKIQKTITDNLVKGSLSFLDRFGEEGKWIEQADTKVKPMLFSFMLEKIIGHISDIYGPQIIESTVIKALNQNLSNTNHESLARLFEKKLIAMVITLNFDNLIEKALQRKGIKPTRICPYGYETDYTQLKNRTLIIKPHGTFNDKASETLGENTDVIFTAKQIGLSPDLHTERCIIHFTRGRSLLVAGYSDDDVDIFPVFQNLYPEEISNVFWVEYARNEVQAEFFKWWYDRGYVSNYDDLRSELKKLYPYARESDKKKRKKIKEALNIAVSTHDRRRGLSKWLVERSPESIIFLGDVRKLWKKVFAKLEGIQFREVPEDSSGDDSLTLAFLTAPNNLPRTALLMSHLLEDSGERNFSVNGLLKNLHQGDYFASDPVKKLFMLSRYSSGLYVIGDRVGCSRLIGEIDTLIRNEKVFGKYGKYYRTEGTAQIAFLELFNFKMLKKKSEILNPIRWLIALWKIIKGRRLLHLTEEMFSQLKRSDFPELGLDYGSGKHRSNDPRWIIYFYLGDVFHSVARFLHYLFGLRTKLSRPLLKKAESYYEKAMEVRGDPSTFDFYRLRLVEVQFLLGKELDWKFLEKRVQLSHENYRRLSNDQQIGYTNIVLALIEFKKDGDRNRITQLLADAKKTFEESDSSRAVNLVKWFSKILRVHCE